MTNLVLGLSFVALIGVILVGVIAAITRTPNTNWLDSAIARTLVALSIGAVALSCLLFGLTEFRVLDEKQLAQIHLNQSSKLLSILGACLGAIAIIGEERLERWDVRVHEWMSKTALGSWAESKQEGILSLFSGRGFGVALVLVFVALLFLCFFSGNPADVMGVVLPVTVCVFLPAILVGLPFIPYLILVPIWLMLSPYRLIRLIEKKHSMERTLLFVGLILTVAGVILQL